MFRLSGLYSIIVLCIMNSIFFFIIRSQQLKEKKISTNFDLIKTMEIIDRSLDVFKYFQHFRFSFEENRRICDNRIFLSLIILIALSLFKSANRKVPASSIRFA